MTLAAKSKILLVDDDGDALRLSERWLAQDQYEVMAAEVEADAGRGQGAKEQCHEKKAGRGDA